MLLFVDSFDNYATVDITDLYTQIYQANGTSIDPIIGPNGRRGTNGMFWDGIAGNVPGNPVALVLDNNETTVFVGGAFTIGGSFGDMAQGDALYPSDGRISTDNGPVSILLYVRQTGRTHLAIRVNTNGTLSVVQGKDGVLTRENYNVLGTTVLALQASETYYIELAALIDVAAGTVDLVVNGDTWLTLAGVATRGDYTPAITDQWDEIVVGRLKSTTSPVSLAVDDSYIANTDATDINNTTVALLGDIQVNYTVPTADDVIDWTPLVPGDNFLMVDEIPPDGDTTYNATITPGNVDTFVTGGTPVAGLGIIAVQVIYDRRRTESGNTSTSPVWRFGGVNYTRAPEGDTSSYTYHYGIWTQRPDTQAAISAALFDGSSVGYEKTT